MKVYKTVLEARGVAGDLARSRNQVMVVVPVHGRFVQEAVILTIDEWIELCTERKFPVKVNAVFDVNGVQADTTLFKDNL